MNFIKEKAKTNKPAFTRAKDTNKKNKERKRQDNKKKIKHHNQTKQSRLS